MAQSASVTALPEFLSAVLFCSIAGCKFEHSIIGAFHQTVAENISIRKRLGKVDFVSDEVIGVGENP